MEGINLQFWNHNHIIVPIDESMRIDVLENEYFPPQLQLLIDSALKYVLLKYFVKY